MAGLVSELGGAINAANAKALTDMIALGQVAAGQTITANDVACGTYNQMEAKNVNGNWQVKHGTTWASATDAEKKILNNSVSEPVNGSTYKVDMVDDIAVGVDGEILAGGLVQLQFKIDQMMAAVQEGIKNTGKVSQTREGAARA